MKKLVLKSILAGLLIISAIIPTQKSEAAPTIGAPIQGSVTFCEGAGIEGAFVTVWSYRDNGTLIDEQTTYSDANGDYAVEIQVPLLEAGYLVIYAEKVGFYEDTSCGGLRDAYDPDVVLDDNSGNGNGGSGN